MYGLVSDNIASTNPLAQTLAAFYTQQQNNSSTAQLVSTEDTVTMSKAAQALSQYQQGQSILQIAAQLGVDVDTVSSYLGLSTQQSATNTQSLLYSLSRLPNAPQNIGLNTIQMVLESITSEENTTTDLLNTIQGYNLPLTGTSLPEYSTQNDLLVKATEQQVYRMNTAEALLAAIPSGNNIDTYA